MILRDKCKELGISLAEGKEKFGLTHWKQEVIEEVVDYIEEKYEPEIKVVEAVSKMVDAVTDQYKIGSIKGLGAKSPFWEERGKLGK